MIVAASRRRNTKITMITSAMVSASVNFTSSTAWRIDIERSFRASSVVFWGSWSWKVGSSAFTLSTTSTVLASGWRCTASTMDRAPSYQLACW